MIQSNANLKRGIGTRRVVPCAAAATRRVPMPRLRLALDWITLTCRGRRHAGDLRWLELARARADKREAHRSRSAVKFKTGSTGLDIAANEQRLERNDTTDYADFVLQAGGQLELPTFIIAPSRRRSESGCRAASEESL